MAFKKKEDEMKSGGSKTPSPFGKPKPSMNPVMPPGAAPTGGAPMPGPPQKKKIFGKPR